MAVSPVFIARVIRATFKDVKGKGDFSPRWRHSSKPPKKIVMYNKKWEKLKLEANKLHCPIRNGKIKIGG